MFCAMTSLLQQPELFQRVQSEIKYTAARRGLEGNLSFPFFFSSLPSRSVTSHLSQAKEEQRDKKKYLAPKISEMMVGCGRFLLPREERVLHVVILRT